MPDPLTPDSGKVSHATRSMGRPAGGADVSPPLPNERPTTAGPDSFDRIAVPGVARTEHALYKVEQEKLERIFRGLLQVVENICQASATLPAPNSDWKSFGAAELASITNALSLHGNAILTKTLAISIANTVALLNRQELKASIIPGISTEDCYMQCLVFLNEYDAQFAADRAFQGITPQPSNWIGQFKQSVERAELEIKSGLSAIADGPLGKLPPRYVRVLDDDASTPLARLQIVPRSISNLADRGGIASREFLYSSPVPMPLAEIMRNLYGRQLPDANLAPIEVREFVAILPIYPGQGLVEFLIELPRENYTQRLLIATGRGPAKPFNLMPQFDPEIANPNHRLIAPIGAPHAIADMKESPFTGRILESLTEERKGRLARDLDLVDSASIVIVSVPLKELPSIDTFRPRGGDDYAVMRGVRSVALHTDVSSKLTGSTYKKSDKTYILHPTLLPTIFVFHTVGVPANSGDLSKK